MLDRSPRPRTRAASWLRRLVLSTSLLASIDAAHAQGPNLARIREAMGQGQWALASTELNVLLSQPLPAATESEARLLRASIAHQRRAFTDALADLDVVDRLGAPLSTTVDALYLRGEVLFEIGRYREAADAFGSFAVRAPRDKRSDRATLYRAESAARSIGCAAADSLYERVLRASVPSAVRQRAAFGRAWCRRRLGDDEAALAGFRSAEGGPDPKLSRDARFEAGVSLFRLKRYEEALQWIPTTDEVPDAVRRDVVVGQSLFALGRKEEALPFLERALVHASDADRGVVLYKIGWSQLELGNAPAALDAFEQLAQSGDSTSAVRSAGAYAKAVALLRLDRTGEALAILEMLRARPNDPWGPDALYALAFARHNLGDYPGSAAMLAELRERYPRSPLNQRADLVEAENFLLTERYDEAVQAFEARSAAEGGASDDDLFRLGVAAYKSEDFAKAEQVFRDLVERYPASQHRIDARYWLAESVYRQDRFDEARQAYDTLRMTNPDGPRAQDAVYGLAWCDYSQAKYAEAAKGFGRLVEAWKGTGREEDALYRRANCYFKLEKYEAAAADYDRLLQSYPQSRLAENAIFQKATSLDRLGRSDEARATFDQVQTRYPASARLTTALLSSAESRFRAGDYAGAADKFSHIVSIASAPDSVKNTARLRLADCYFAQSDFNRAAALYEALSAPSMPQSIREKAYEGRVRSLENAGRSKEAQKEAQVATQAFPDEASGQAAYEIGIRQLDEGHLAEGVSSLREFLKRGVPAEHVGEAYRRCADASVRLGDKAAAADFYRGAAEHAKNGEAINDHFEAGRLLYEVGKYTDARDEFGKVLPLGPDAATRDFAMYNLGLAQKETGEEAKALESIGRVAANQSADKSLRADALLEAGLLARKLGQLDLAQRYLCECAVVGAATTAAEAQYWCAECDFDRGKFDDAIAGYGRLIKEFTTESEWIVSARYRMAEAFEKLNRWKEARTQYEEILSGTKDATWAADARARLDWMKENAWVFDEKPGGDPSRW